MAEASALAIATALMCSATVLRAQGSFAGAWTVTSWKVAPWVAAADLSYAKPNAAVNGHVITFGARKISGPSLIACANPHYEIKSVPFDMLFEGGLKQPQADATALGLKAPVKTLIPGCDFEFHLKDANTALFALDNVIYTMVRKPTSTR